MIKNKLYGKTERIKEDGKYVIITEKLDGSNLCIFKKDGNIYYAQRNNIMLKEEITKQIAYQGLIEWVEEHHGWLEENLHEGSVICGEWLYMGKLKYPEDKFPNRFNMFAKANITNEWTLENKIYDHDKLIYPFINQEIPDFISLVPIVATTNKIPNKLDLDMLYSDYLSDVNRNVEGFVINVFNNVRKYVRMKNGKLTEYSQIGGDK